MSISVTSIPILLLSEIIPELTGAIKYHKCTDTYNQNFKEFNFDTIIMDKTVLLKTLIEHEVQNIVEKDNTILCNYEDFYLEFYKTDEEKPYKLKISCCEQKNIKEFINNISSQYTINTQEASYNKIKERLKEQNLEIEDEEVFEDNTIVLTVNLE